MSFDQRSKASYSHELMQQLILLLLQRPYICDYPGCTKRYTDPSSLRKHKNNSHLKKARSDERESGDDGSSGMAHGAEGGSSSKVLQKVQRAKPTRRSSASTLENMHMMETSSMMKGPAFHSALKPEAMYYTDSSELPFMKAHTDPGPAALQRVRNNIGSYHMSQEDPQYCADGRDYNAYYHEAGQKQSSSGGIGLALPVVQHSSWAPHTAEHPHHPHPTLNQLSSYAATPLRGHLFTRAGSNGSSIASNGPVAPSPAESMLSSASIETARTNQTYPGTKRQTADHATFTPSLRNHSAVSTFGRNHSRHHSHPSMNGSSEQQSARPFQRNLSQGSVNHAYPSRHNLLPPLQSNKALGYDLCDALPSFSDVQSASSCSMDAYRIPSTVDMIHHTHPPEYLACQQSMPSSQENFVFDGPLHNDSHLMHLPSYSEAMCTRVASSNMVLGDSSTHLMSLPRESSFLECLHSRPDMEGLY